MRKRVLSILLAAVMVVSLLPTVAFAGGEILPDEGHSLIVLKDGQKATAGAKADGSDGADYYWWGETLRLFKDGLTVTGTTNGERIIVLDKVSNLTIKDLAMTGTLSSVSCMVEFKANCTLTVLGKNSITGSAKKEDDTVYALFFKKGGTITGSGNLSVSAPDGIHTEDVITLDCTGTITADCEVCINAQVNSFVVTENTGKILVYGSTVAIYSYEQPQIDQSLAVTASDTYRAAEKDIIGEAIYDASKKIHGYYINSNPATSVLIVPNKPEGAEWLVHEGDNYVWYKLEDGNTKLTIGGTGDMPNFRDSIPWNSQKGEIQTIIIQSGVTSIGQIAFKDCKKLTSVTIPAGVTSIGTSAFYECTSLAAVIIPSSVTSIGKSAFQECTNLKTVSFAETPMLESIGDQAFVQTSLTSITIPAKVTEIGIGAFDQCASLQSIDVNIANTKYTSDGGVLFNKDKSTLICYPPAKTGTKYAIPNTVTSISDYAFRRCKNLIEIEIPSTVTSIGSSAFNACTSLAAVIIPSSVTQIKDFAFRGCSSLASVISLAVTPPTLGTNVFKDCAVPNSITVPSQSVDVYKKDTGWSTYADKVVGDHIVDGVIFEPWTSTDSLPTTAGNYYLNADVEISSTWDVPTGATPTNLDLNGHVIKANGSDFSVITVPNAATLNLHDSDETEHDGYVDTTGLWHLGTGEGTAKTVTGGCITGGNCNDGGGVLINSGGTFNMLGGTIAGNTAKNCGGGVNVQGIFNMNGGVIEYNKDTTDNSSWGGGGVAIYNNGKAALSGGEIRCNSSGTLGGGILILYDHSGQQKVTMAGVSIINNTAGANGGGVCVTTDGVTNTIVGGSTKITSNVIGGEIVDGILSGGAINNFYLSSGKYIELDTDTDAPKQDMSVGITTNTDPTESIPVQFTSNGSSNDAKYFFADKSTYYVDFDNNHLVLKLIPQSTITFDANEGTCASRSAITSVEGKLAVLPTATRNGYTFNGWYTTTSGGIKVTTSTVFTFDTTIYAQWTKIPAPSYDSGSSSSTVTVPVTGDENTVKVSATVSGNTATVKDISAADLEKVTEGESVSIDLSAAGKNVDTAKIPTQTVEKIAEKSAMIVKLPVATVEFDKVATEEIADQAKGSNIELVVDDVKEVSLNAIQKEAVGKLDTAVIIDAYLESNGSKLCTSDNGGFGGGSAKVILPYEIKNNRKPENYSVFYVNEAGKLEKLNAAYDEELKAFVFEIEHFSVYAVAFEQFVDIDANAYYYDAVKWAAANGVTDGTDDAHFSPNGITNRAQMVTFLWRAAGKPEPTLTECPFTDVKAGSYYYKAVLWAYEKGITDGTSETTFEPFKNVSRAQTVTFLWRYAGGLYVDYWMQMTDVASGQYYTEAVRWALAEGITEGTSKTTFSPNKDCLRGQIVTFLYRSLVE